MQQSLNRLGACDADDVWKAARLAYIPKTDAIDLGVMCCSPQREGFEVTFKDFGIREPISRELH